MKIDVFTLVARGSAKLTVPRDLQEQNQVGRTVALCYDFDLNVSLIHLTDKF